MFCPRIIARLKILRVGGGGHSRVRKVGIWVQYLSRRYCAYRETIVLEGSVDSLARGGLLSAICAVPADFNHTLVLLVAINFINSEKA